MLKKLILIFIVCILATAYVSADWPSNLNTNLISYYNFEQTSGHLLDQVGTGSSTAETITSRNVAGIVNNGWDFEWSSTDVLTMGTGELTHIDVNDARTISVWLKPESLSLSGGSQTPYGYGTAGDNQKWAFLLIYDANLIRIDTYNANCQLSIAGDAFIKVGQWELYTVTYDGTNCKFYRNNTLLGTVAPSAVPNTATTSFEIGRGLSVNENRVDGVMDEMGMWSRALNSTEINQLWNGGSGITYQSNTPPTTPNPVINMTDVSNKSSYDMTCNFMCSDPDAGNTMTYDIDWLKGGNNLSSGAWFGIKQFGYTGVSCVLNTYTTATMKSGNISGGQIWWCSVRLYDQIAYSAWTNSSYPQITLGTSTACDLGCVKVSSGCSAYAVNGCTIISPN